MIRSKIIYLIYFVLLAIFIVIMLKLSQQRIISKPNDLESDTTRIFRTCWINAQYLDWIKTDFPSRSGFNTGPFDFLIFDSLNYVEYQCYNELCISKIKIEIENQTYSFVDGNRNAYFVELINDDSMSINDELYLSDEGLEKWE
jgi:hypothetical protein